MRHASSESHPGRHVLVDRSHVYPSRHGLSAVLGAQLAAQNEMRWPMYSPPERHSAPDSQHVVPSPMRQPSSPSMPTFVQYPAAQYRVGIDTAPEGWPTISSPGSPNELASSSTHRGLTRQPRVLVHASPTSHDAGRVQYPRTHDMPPQRAPHLPQFSGSLAVSTQVPAQST
jgi:hypothetical protein